MAAHHRHQSSLEQVPDFSSPPSLTTDEIAQASHIFDRIINYCQPLQSDKPYKKITLVGVMYEHSRSKDIFLRQFFIFLGTQNYPDDQQSGLSEGLSRFSRFEPATATADQAEDVKGAIYSFADYLFDNFFLPLKTAGHKTPQPTPAALSAPAVENVTGTPERLATLRRDCLIRDHHRCVITRVFDHKESRKRFKRDGANAKDDDNHPLIEATRDPLQVAHIIPHSITSLGGEFQLSESKKAALTILNMFDPGVIHLIDGHNIDRPTNALTMTDGAHTRFGDFEIYFEPMDPSRYPPHTYKIDTIDKEEWARPSYLPVTRTLHLSPNHTIDPPSQRLLDIHWACCTILHLSAAGEYIDKILRDMEDPCVRSDGSAELGHLVRLRYGGWVDGVAS